MTAEAGRVPGAMLPHHISPWSRVYGLGSIYAKTLRDSRLAVIIVAGLVGILLLSSGAAFGEAYATVQSREELKLLVQSLPPALAGVYGNPFPIAIETLGGSIGWKTAASLGLLVEPVVHPGAVGHPRRPKPAAAASSSSRRARSGCAASPSRSWPPT